MNNKKKVCFLMEDPFSYGGEQRVVSKLSNLLYQDNYDVTIICTRMKKKDLDIYNLNANIKIVNFTPGNHLQDLPRKLKWRIRKFNSIYGILKNNTYLLEKLLCQNSLRKKIIKLINNEKYDYAIGVSSDFSVILASIKSELKVNTKIIGWQHSNYQAYFERRGRRFFNEKKLFEKLSSKFDGYVVLTDDDAQKVQKNFKIVATRIFNPLSFEDVEKSKLDNNMFIAYGRIDRVKGFDLLIEAYSKYVELGGTWKLQIIGNGAERENLKKMIIEKKIEDNVYMYDFTNNVQKYLNTSTIFLFPSRWEGFGMSLTESMQFGLPSICYDLNPFREITQGFQSSILIEKFDTSKFAEAMYELSNNRKKIEEMSEQAILNCKKFSNENIVSLWRNLMESLNK